MTEDDGMGKEYFFDKPNNVKWFFRIFYGILAVLVAADFYTYFFTHPHTEFAWEEWPLFYAVFGFVAFVLLVFVAKYILRPLVKRREDYYD
jgi:hypothetical protein